jgi:hypothetical protein
VILYYVIYKNIKTKNSVLRFLHSRLLWSSKRIKYSSQLSKRFMFLSAPTVNESHRTSAEQSLAFKRISKLTFFIIRVKMKKQIINKGNLPTQSQWLILKGRVCKFIRKKPWKQIRIVNSRAKSCFAWKFLILFLSLSQTFPWYVYISWIFPLR